MELNERFENLYQSLIQKDVRLNRSLQNVSKKKRSYNPGSHQTFKRIKSSSSSITSETFIISSQHSAMSPYRLHNETVLIRSIRSTSEQRVTTFSQGEEILSVKEELHQESGCELSGPNSVTTVHDESVCHDNCESECSDNTSQASDGYQSGETKMNDARRLCKDCKNLYKKVRKRKPAIIKDPCTTDPRPWYNKFWIYKYRVSARGSGKTLKRGLGSVLKRLGGMQISRWTPTTRSYWTCCRSHLFLKRNIRLRKEEQKKFLENKGGKKRKKKRKSWWLKKAVPMDQAEGSMSQISIKTNNAYSFVFNSSHEGEGGPDIKRYKLEPKTVGRKSLLTQIETHNSTSVGLMHSPTPCFGRMTPLDHKIGVAGQQRVIESPGHDTRLYSPVHIGSFREQLEKLNMGLLKSTIVNED